MNRHKQPIARHAAANMSAIGWVMIAYSSNCFINSGWLASIVEGDSIITQLYLLYYVQLFIDELLAMDHNVLSFVFETRPMWNEEPYIFLPCQFVNLI